MARPAGAILEAVIPHPSGEVVALYDVSHLLPTKQGRPQPARPAGSKIQRLYVHKSGGEGGPGIAGILGMVRFVVQRRMFPGAPYTFWAATAPERDAEGRLVLADLRPDCPDPLEPHRGHWPDSRHRSARPWQRHAFAAAAPGDCRRDRDLDSRAPARDRKSVV